MKVKIAQIQAHVYEEKSKNLEELERNLKRIKDENIDLVTWAKCSTARTRHLVFRSMRKWNREKPGNG